MSDAARLRLPDKTFTVATPFATFTCRPLSTAVVEACKADALTRVRALKEEGVLEEIARRFDAVPDLSPDAIAAGYEAEFYAKGLGRAVIVGWDLEEPAVPSPAAIDALMEQHPIIAVAFLERYTAALTEAYAEGNGLRLASHGKRAAGRDNATNAAKAAAADGTAPPGSSDP